MPTQDSNPASSNGKSEGSMVFAIQSLTEQAQRLAASYGWWARASQILIGATALVTVAYFVFSGIALKRASELRDAQDALSKSKDDNLANDLKAKDVLIADADRK